MSTFTSTTTLLIVILSVCAAWGFSVHPLHDGAAAAATSTQLHMGLFDGVREAFSAPAGLERSVLDSERETPIDRWMGWSVVSENSKTRSEAQVPIDYVDSMDESNYVIVELEKPMGIVFEENDEKYGGIFVQSLKEGGIAATQGSLQDGDQLIAVNRNKVGGLPFDEALGAIVASNEQKTRLVFFRGSAKQFYGPTGPSQKWLDEFVANKGSQQPASSAE